MTCTASGTATAGQYQNTATATASGDLPASHKKLQPLNSNVSDSDSSYYFGVAPEEILGSTWRNSPTTRTRTFHRGQPFR